MSRIYGRVSRVATWAGWCSPCERADRPLVLTRSGPGGLRSWLSGLSDEDRLLLLTCRVCGRWQLVPAREEDDPEIVLEQDDPVEAVAELVAVARSADVAAADVPAPAAPVVVPAPRAVVERIVTVPESVTLPAFSPEAVEAAARVLAAARAQAEQAARRRAVPAARRPGTRSARRPQHAPSVRVVPALPAVLALPTGTRQVVLAATG